MHKISRSIENSELGLEGIDGAVCCWCQGFGFVQGEILAVNVVSNKHAPTNCCALLTFISFPINQFGTTIIDSQAAKLYTKKVSLMTG
jgi:hypothetical protein